jgi:hypothetical protein
MIDDECGAVGGMRIGRRNRSIRRNRAPMPLCSQIPHHLTWTRTRVAAYMELRLSSSDQFLHFRLFAQLFSTSFPTLFNIFFVYVSISSLHISSHPLKSLPSALAPFFLRSTPVCHVMCARRPRFILHVEVALVLERANQTCLLRRGWSQTWRKPIQIEQKRVMSSSYDMTSRDKTAIT